MKNKKIIYTIFAMLTLSVLVLANINIEVTEAKTGLLRRIVRTKTDENTAYFYFTMGSTNEEITEIEIHNGDSRTIKKLEKSLDPSSNLILPINYIKIDGATFTVEYKVNLDKNDSNYKYNVYSTVYGTFNKSEESTDEPNLKQINSSEKHKMKIEDFHGYCIVYNYGLISKNDDGEKIPPYFMFFGIAKNIERI